jgi:hypothetical protein
VWERSEYVRLPRYDGETFEQPTQVFLCHQMDGRICAGWAGCHDMSKNLAIRIAAVDGSLTEAELETVHEYVSPVSLFESGQAAAEHGLAEVDTPSPEARRMSQDLIRKRALAQSRERMSS